MAHAFQPRRDGTFACRLEPEEAAVIEQIAGEITDLIRMDLGLVPPGTDTRDAQSSLESIDPLARLEAETVLDALAHGPRDEAVKRLFPDASADEGEAAEIRRFTQRALAGHHLESLALVRASLAATSVPESFGHALAGDLRVEAEAERNEVGAESAPTEVRVDARDVGAWLKALNVMRLVLGERMGLAKDGDFTALQLMVANDLEDTIVEEDGHASAGLEYLASLYEFLSWLQESLLVAIELSDGE